MEQAKKDMGNMLDYIDMLNELDTEGVEPMSHVFPVQNVFREDVVENGDGGEDTLANAPDRRDRAFVVPKTVEKGGAAMNLLSLTAVELGKTIQALEVTVEEEPRAALGEITAN